MQNSVRKTQRPSLQTEFLKTPSKHRYSHGGTLRQLRQGRTSRPLSFKDPIHLVLKANKSHLKSGLRTYRRYFLILNIMETYRKRFFIKIDQFSIQNDHIHLLIKARRRSQYQSFFRVFAGQVAQQMEKQGLAFVADTPRTKLKLWKYRPFTRVVRGWRAYAVVRQYIELNEHEALRRISYSKHRLKGLSSSEWQLIWA